MATTLEQILSGANLTGVIQATKSGVPQVLPPQFLAPTRQVKGNTTTYRKVEGTRQVARIAHYGSPSQRRELQSVSDVPVTLLHTIEHQVHDPLVLQSLKSVNETEQTLGEQEIARQVREFRTLFDNLRVAAATSALALGAIYFDGNGNLLPSSSGAVVSVDFGVPSGNKAQLDVFGDGDIIDASWATDGTDIINQVIALRKAAVKLTGYPIRHAFYGTNVFEYLVSNTAISGLIEASPGMAETVAEGRLPSSLLGLDWHPIYEAFFVDQDGTAQEIVGADTVVFTPDPDPTWWEFVEGSYLVPNNLGNVGGDATAALGNLSQVYGMFSYGQVLSDPPAIKHVAGDTFLPVLKVPAAVFIADVTP